MVRVGRQYSRIGRIGAIGLRKTRILNPSFPKVGTATGVRWPRLESQEAGLLRLPEVRFTCLPDRYPRPGGKPGRGPALAPADRAGLRHAADLAPQAERIPVMAKFPVGNRTRSFSMSCAALHRQLAKKELWISRSRGPEPLYAVARLTTIVSLEPATVESSHRRRSRNLHFTDGFGRRKYVP